MGAVPRRAHPKADGALRESARGARIAASNTPTPEIKKSDRNLSNNVLKNLLPLVTQGVAKDKLV